MHNNCMAEGKTLLTMCSALIHLNVKVIAVEKHLSFFLQLDFCSIPVELNCLSMKSSHWIHKIQASGSVLFT